MNVLRSTFSASQTLEEIGEAMTPSIRKTIGMATSAARSQWRKALGVEGLTPEQVAAILPRASAGRPKGEAKPFKGLSKAVRAVISDALGLSDFPTGLEGWHRPEDVDAAANAITTHFTNMNSAASALSAFRNGLRSILVPDEVIQVAQRPDLSAARCVVGDKRTGERAAEGLTVPYPYRTIAGLRERVAEYLKQGKTWTPCGQSAADLLVTLSARPGEAETLTVGERGGVTGVLKKKGDAGESYPIISALGVDTARAFLIVWKKASTKSRARAMKDLEELTRAWNIQRRDLRAIGGHLAGRAAQLAGDASNPTQLRTAVIGALRHKPVICPVEHYTRINDPAPALSARFAELSTEKQAQILALMDA